MVTHLYRYIAASIVNNYTHYSLEINYDAHLKWVLYSISDALNRFSMNFIMTNTN